MTSRLHGVTINGLGTAFPLCVGQTMKHYSTGVRPLIMHFPKVYLIQNRKGMSNWSPDDFDNRDREFCCFILIIIKQQLQQQTLSRRHSPIILPYCNIPPDLPPISRPRSLHPHGLSNGGAIFTPLFIMVMISSVCAVMLIMVFEDGDVVIVYVCWLYWYWCLTFCNLFDAVDVYSSILWHLHITHVCISPYICYYLHKYFVRMFLMCVYSFIRKHSFSIINQLL